jgi:hypothetical protein
MGLLRGTCDGPAAQGERPLFPDEATFAGTRGNGQDAPIPVVRGITVEALGDAKRLLRLCKNHNLVLVLSPTLYHGRPMRRRRTSADHQADWPYRHAVGYQLTWRGQSRKTSRQSVPVVPRHW